MNQIFILTVKSTLDEYIYIRGRLRSPLPPGVAWQGISRSIPKCETLHGLV